MVQTTIALSWKPYSHQKVPWTFIEMYAGINHNKGNRYHDEIVILLCMGSANERQCYIVTRQWRSLWNMKHTRAMSTYLSNWYSYIPGRTRRITWEWWNKCCFISTHYIFFTIFLGDINIYLHYSIFSDMKMLQVETLKKKFQRLISRAFPSKLSSGQRMSMMTTQHWFW